MGLLRKFLNDYFDDAALEISRNGGKDSDQYDDNENENDPANPIWDGAEIQRDPYGVDPTWPDPNEVNQD